MMTPSSASPFGHSLYTFLATETTWNMVSTKKSTSLNTLSTTSWMAGFPLMYEATRPTVLATTPA